MASIRDDEEVIVISDEESDTPTDEPLIDTQRSNVDDDGDDVQQDIVIPDHIEEHNISDEIIQFYFDHFDQYIADDERRGPVLDRVNIRLNEQLITRERLTSTLFSPQTFAFRVNASVGSILRNNRTGELRYFYACFNNNALLESAQLVTNLDEWNQFLNLLSNLDYTDLAASQRPNTEWSVVWITNIVFYVFKIQNRLLGAPPDTTPAFLKNNIGLCGLFMRKGKRYTDNLCLFRALAVHRGYHQSGCETEAKNYLRDFKGCDVADYAGANLEDIDSFEKHFKVNVTIFTLKETDEVIQTGSKKGQKKTRADLVRRSKGRYQSTMYLNAYKGHFSYIQDLNKYSSSFVCSKCQKSFPASTDLCSHVRKCKGAETKFIFPGGVYTPPPTLREELMRQNIQLPPTLQFHPYRIVFDIESYFPASETNPVTDPEKLTFTERHVPLSVSVCSNVPGHTDPVCLITNGNSQKMVEDMVRTMEDIQSTSFELLEAEAKPVFRQIDQMLTNIADVDEAAEQHPLHGLKSRLYKFINTIPVIGFSSGRYDLNVLKPFLLPYFTSEKDLIVKRTNQFLLLSNDTLKFLDIQNYLAPGYSYKQYLAAYNCTETKSFFPYEWVSDLEKLDEKQFPPKEAFNSSLTGASISEEDYQQCLNVWNEKGMKTFRDWLIHYNNMDTVPFLEALEKQSQFFRDRNLDMFFDAVSLPGLTDRFVHSTTPAGTFFPLFNRRNCDLYSRFRESVCGGPSIVFCRKHEKGNTTIRSADPTIQDKTTCDTIEGWDASSLYLRCLADPMPNGFHYQRKKENAFRLESAYRQSEGCLEWLSYIQETEGHSIAHVYNTGKERRFGGRQIPVDGWDEVNQVAYQYHGCYFHGHTCYLTRNMDPSEKQKRADHSRDVDRYLQKLGVRVRMMKECQWLQLKKQHPHKSTPTSPAWRKGPMTQEQILTLVLSGELFGIVEVDIHVPEHLHQKFSEFSPIFKNTNVRREDLGEGMRKFAEDNGMMTQPRRCLISSYFGKRMMIITPLLQWYLKQGLVVDCVYEVVQYHPSTCFHNFMDQVTAARREADSDPTKSIMGSSFKLLGNSSYGRSLMRKEKHKDVVVVDEDGAKEAINSPYFDHLTQISSSHYEVQFRKKSVILNLPIQIGLFVYGYAKLRLLRFYYEFIDFYIDRRDFELICCDTDSLYMALSHDSLDDSVKSERKAHFLKHRDEWLPARQCPDHKGSPILSPPPPPPCCASTHVHQTREPGLWKLEAKADQIIALAPKCYICVGNEGTKSSTKGVQKRINPFVYSDFERVLDTKQSRAALNRGFRLDPQQNMRTYIQPKRGLCYLYTKREVLEDGVSTRPLQL